MESLLKGQGVPWAKDGTTFENTYDGIRSHMKYSENNTMETMVQAMAPDQVAEHFGSKILGLDEAFDVLEEVNHRLAKTEQTQVESEMTAKESFAKEFRKTCSARSLEPEA